MYVDIPEYLFPKLKKAAKHLNVPVSELVLDALISYMQDLDDLEASKKNSSHSSSLPDTQERSSHQR